MPNDSAVEQDDNRFQLKSAELQTQHLSGYANSWRARYTWSA